MRLLGWIGRALRWIKERLGFEPRVVSRPHRQLGGREKAASGNHGWTGNRERPGGFDRPGLHPAGRSRPTTYDEASVSVGRLSMDLKSSSDLPFPYELTIVVPRVEIAERYVDGKLVEVTSTYSSVTIARSPRFEGGGRNRTGAFH